MEEPTIKDLRAETGMTQGQFAEYFGVSIRSLQGWESGKKPPQGMVGMMDRIWKLEGELRGLRQGRDLEDES